MMLKCSLLQSSMLEGPDLDADKGSWTKPLRGIGAVL